MPNKLLEYVLCPVSPNKVCPRPLGACVCLSMHLLPQVSTLLFVAMDVICLSRVAGSQSQSVSDASRDRLQRKKASTMAAMLYGSMEVIYTVSP